MKRFWPLYFWIAVLTLVVSGRCAAAIELNASVTPEIAGDRLMVYVVIENQGFEPALSLSASINDRDTIQQGPLADRLEVGERCDTTFSFSLGQAQGAFPLLSQVFFHDESWSRYSLTLVTPWAQTEAPSVLELAFDLPEPEIRLVGRRQQNLALRIANPSETAKKVRLRLFAPDELAVSPQDTLLVAPAGVGAGVAFTIGNRFFNPGSSTSLYAVAEYEEEGFHYSTVAEVFAFIEAEENIFAPWQTYFVGAAALLLVVLALANRRKYPSEPSPL